MRWQPAPCCATSPAQATLYDLQALDALAACPLLQHLACIGNPVTALEPLPALASLAAQRCGVACLADLRPLALARHLTRLALAGNPAVAGLSPRRRRVLIGNLLPGECLSGRRLATDGILPQGGALPQGVAWCSVQPCCSQHATVV